MLLFAQVSIGALFALDSPDPSQPCLLGLSSRTSLPGGSSEPMRPRDPRRYSRHIMSAKSA